MIFLKDVLEMQNPEKDLANCRWTFIDKLICAIHNTLPFQNVSLMAQPPACRHRPTEEEIKSAMLERTGGLCYSLNFFTFSLLKSLGYDVYLNSAIVLSPTTTMDDHLLVLVKNLRENDDLYLVDTGCGYPTFRTVSLDFENESPAIQESFLRYKFDKTGTKVRRLHYTLLSDTTLSIQSKLWSNTKPAVFKSFYEFEINPEPSIDFINANMDIIYTNSDVTPFHKTLRAMKFNRNKLVLLSNMKLTLESDDGGINEIVLPNDEELLNAYKKYFPEIQNTLIERAISNWRKCESHQ